ncbi:MAG: helix-turn-helix domain-containing protein [Pseudomonadota bacterium]
MAATTFSLEDQPAHLRLDCWRAATSETFVGLDCEAPVERPLAGSITSAPAGDVTFSHVDTVAQTVRRTPRLIRRDQAEVMLVSVQLSGRGVISQDGRAARLGPGDFALYDSTRPYSLAFDGAFDQLVLHMPRALLRRRLGPLGALTARRFAGRGGGAAAGAASGYLGGLAAGLGALDEGGAARLGALAVDLMALAVAEGTGRDAGGAGDDALRLRAERAVEARFAEPGFATPALAATLGVSTRRLQEVFAAAGKTPMGAIWSKRLEVAAARLVDPVWARSSITEIALSCGFADPQQFSRRFRAAFGETPRSRRSAGR